MSVVLLGNVIALPILVRSYFKMADGKTIVHISAKIHIGSFLADKKEVSGKFSSKKDPQQALNPSLKWSTCRHQNVEREKNWNSSQRIHPAMISSIFSII